MRIGQFVKCLTLSGLKAIYSRKKKKGKLSIEKFRSRLLYHSQLLTILALVLGRIEDFAK